MVFAMSPELVRLVFVSGLSIIAGGAIGAYATRSIYGESAALVHPVQIRDRPCPACAECPICPQAPDCEDRGLVPTSTAPRAILLPDTDEPEQKRPGLPATAIRLASDRVRIEVAACVEESLRTGAQGTVLLELTVTATGSKGFISEANLATRSSGTVSSESIDRCLIEGARRARFDWPEDDGEAHLRLPVRLGR